MKVLKCLGGFIFHSLKDLEFYSKIEVIQLGLYSFILRPDKIVQEKFLS